MKIEYRDPSNREPIPPFARTEINIALQRLVSAVTGREDCSDSILSNLDAALESILKAYAQMDETPR